ncbi:UDP-N-acetylglucosamine diphosphorylase [Ramicandelaber brevisporus]|nr:UDP-N-acetylglucosamine diphosphorylase [Ramicandelaber brevisporus]
MPPAMSATAASSVSNGTASISNGKAAPAAVDVTALRDAYTAAGQGHVFSFWDTLSASEQSALAAQLSRFDPARLNRLFERATKPVSPGSDASSSLEPLPKECTGSTLGAANSEVVAEWRATGLRAIADNKVGVILMAGGQGTRLGSSAPKGCYDIGLPSHKSLFAIQAERILRLQEIAAPFRTNADLQEPVSVPWCVMTSEPTHAATIAHFEENNFFGIDRANVFFFEQGVLPCFGLDGKVLLESSSKLAVAPDGNGGVYAAFRNSGLYAELERRGVEFVHSYAIDNCLVRVADPVFVGYSISKGAECGVKVVPKSSWNEPVGVICRRGGQFQVVEYSEISTEMAQLTDSDTGALVYGAGNICNHFYTMDFLARVPTFEDRLEHHVAKKKISYVDAETGEVVKPTKPNGIKLEQFVFDVFPFVTDMAVLDVARNEEFAPLKNAPGSGSDCPETSRRDTALLHIKYARDAGATVELDESLATLEANPSGVIQFEISPLVSYGGEGLEALKGKTLTLPFTLNSRKELEQL